MPKTLIFAKDDSHAEDIVEIVREEFGEGNDFCQKITYKTTGSEAAQTSSRTFRNSATSRASPSRGHDRHRHGHQAHRDRRCSCARSRAACCFEQMKGRGVRVIDPTELRAVTPDALAKTHFVIVDCVGITETQLADTQPLERKRTVPFKTLLEHVAHGRHRPGRAVVPGEPPRAPRPSSAARGGARASARLRWRRPRATSPTGSSTALDPDRQLDEARSTHGLRGADQEPTEAQVKQAAEELAKRPSKPLADEARAAATSSMDLKRESSRSSTRCRRTSCSRPGSSARRRRRPRRSSTSFERFIEEHKDEIDALQFFYAQPYASASVTRTSRRWLRRSRPAALVDAGDAVAAYEKLEKDKVRGASGKRLLTDIVSLVRFALHQDDELVPYADRCGAVRELDGAAGEPRAALHRPSRSAGWR